MARAPRTAPQKTAAVQKIRVLSQPIRLPCLQNAAQLGCTRTALVVVDEHADNCSHDGGRDDAHNDAATTARLQGVSRKQDANGLTR